MAISIKDVARHYAELPHQNKALDLLQIELSKLGLTADSCPWVDEFRTEPKAPIAPPGKSIAASESVRGEYTGVIDWNNPNCYISKYFTVLEVTKGDRRRTPVVGSRLEKNILMMGKEMDKVREAWKHPIGISSWSRPEPINSQVGGVDGSTHCLGFGVDSYPLAGGNIFEYQKWLDERWYGNFGYGAVKKFVHTDMGNGKGFMSGGSKGRRWDY